MAPTPPLASVVLRRRTLLAASATGLGALLAGCTSDDGPARLTSRQADALVAQVGVQQALVASFTAAAAADPALGAQVTAQAAQARQQLDRLAAAATGASSSARSSAAVPAGQDVRGWLRTQVSTTADSHASACLGQTGGRAALLGSIAAGLRGMDGRLA